MGRKKKPLPLLENVRISDLAAEGKAIAKVRFSEQDEDAFVVFIPYGAPGDVADIKIDRRKHRYAEGHIVNLKSAAEMRVEPKCRHFGVCGGCKWEHIPYSEQLKQKHKQVSDALTRIGKVALPEILPTLGSEQIWNYRNKMEYTFSNKKWRTWEEVNSGSEFTDSCNALGFHIPGCFDKVLHITQCELQAPFGNEIRNYIFEYAEAQGLSFYDIKTNKGFLRTLMIRHASTGELMVCLVFGEKDQTAADGLLSDLSERFPQITSLLYVFNLKLNDTIGDQQVMVYKGNDYIEEEMEGLKFRVNAKSFYQTNSCQAYELYKVARRFAGLDKKSDNPPLVYDLYTGTGTIANFVARNASRVIGIEYVEEAIDDAKLNSCVNGINNTLFFAGDMKDILTDDFIAVNGRPDIMIVDPPRAGMHPDVVGVILNAEPDIIVYVSCNPATQARDLAMLDAKYVVTDVQPVDMFPHTHHVENVVRLAKRS